MAFKDFLPWAARPAAASGPSASSQAASSGAAAPAAAASRGRSRPWGLRTLEDHGSRQNTKLIKAVQARRLDRAHHYLVDKLIEPGVGLEGRARDAIRSDDPTSDVLARGLLKTAIAGRPVRVHDNGAFQVALAQTAVDLGATEPTLRAFLPLQTNEQVADLLIHRLAALESSSQIPRRDAALPRGEAARSEPAPAAAHSSPPDAISASPAMASRGGRFPVRTPRPTGPRLLDARLGPTDARAVLEAGAAESLVWASLPHLRDRETIALLLDSAAMQAKRADPAHVQQLLQRAQTSEVAAVALDRGANPLERLASMRAGENRIQEVEEVLLAACERARLELVEFCGQIGTSQDFIPSLSRLESLLARGANPGEGLPHANDFMLHGYLETACEKASGRLRNALQSGDAAAAHMSLLEGADAQGLSSALGETALSPAMQSLLNDVLASLRYDGRMARYLLERQRVDASQVLLHAGTQEAIQAALDRGANPVPRLQRETDVEQLRLLLNAGLDRQTALHCISSKALADATIQGLDGKQRRTLFRQVVPTLRNQIVIDWMLENRDPPPNWMLTLAGTEEVARAALGHRADPEKRLRADRAAGKPRSAITDLLEAAVAARQARRGPPAS